MVKTVYFVRHGETCFNRQRRLQGWLDSPLSEEGEQHARQVAQSLLPLGIRHALASPLGRARQTAEIIQSILPISVEPIDDLREVSFGAFEGNTLDEIETMFPGQWKARMADKWNYCPPEGEANKDAVPRARRVVERIETWSQPEPLLIIAHFAINRIVLALLAGLSPDVIVRIDVPHLAVYRAQQENGRWQIGYQELEQENSSFQPGWLEQNDPARPMGG